jgi:stearoyl-CoA desaturase (delta-9 desaturase)
MTKPERAIGSEPARPAEAAEKNAIVAPERRLLWHNILFMTLNPLAALVLTPIYLASHGFSWGLLTLLIITYSISNMVITCGYHRYFAHRSYEVHPLIEFLYIFVGAGAFQGSVLAWATDHRRHHREVDSDADPYSINKGFWYAHLTWMFTESDHPEAKSFPKDLTKNKWIVFQHEYYVWIATFMGFIVPGLIGLVCGFGFWGGAIIGGSLRIALSQHSTFLINSAAHTFGERPYTDKNSARDSVIMAFLTFGEGYHNFHHHFQADYRNGVCWYHWDPTKWWIKSLATIGLAWRLKRARRDEILKAQLSMEEQEMMSKGAPHERLAQLKIRIMDAQQTMRQLRDEYAAAKSTLNAKREKMSRDMRHQVTMQIAQIKRIKKAEIKMAKLEFKSAYGQWCTFRRIVCRTSVIA